MSASLLPHEACSPRTDASAIALLVQQSIAACIDGAAHVHVTDSYAAASSYNRVNFASLTQPNVQAIGKEAMTVSLQFAALCRLDDPYMAANERSELESLMYCFLFTATGNQLHWKRAAGLTTARDAKGYAMQVPEAFERKVLERIADPGLKQMAVKLQQLFFGRPAKPVSVAAFNACFA